MKLQHELWRGGVNPWDCDEMGHWNVRRYIARLDDGLAEMAALLGLDGPGPCTRSALNLTRAHIRFLRECRPGQPLVLTGGILRFQNDHAQFLFELHHLTGPLAATFVADVDHVDPTTLRPFGWPQRAHQAAQHLTCTLPTHAMPKGVDMAAPLPAPSLARAHELDLTPIARARVQANDCDLTNHMKPEAFIGAVSDGFDALTMQWKRDPSRNHLAEGIGRAALEYRLDVHAMPPVGTRYVVMSGLASVTDKTRLTAHWLLDPASGQAYATLLSVSGAFDLQARKIISHGAETTERLQTLTIPALTHA